MNFAIAVKSLIINNQKVLTLKRRDDNPHAAGEWDIPGGRLEPGENPFDGLKRETLEETNLQIDIMKPLDVQHFTREDGQIITMIVFICKPRILEELKISDEHDEFKWIRVGEISDFCPWLKDSIANI